MTPPGMVDAQKQEQAGNIINNLATGFKQANNYIANLKSQGIDPVKVLNSTEMKDLLKIPGNERYRDSVANLAAIYGPTARPKLQEVASPAAEQISHRDMPVAPAPAQKGVLERVVSPQPAEAEATTYIPPKQETPAPANDAALVVTPLASFEVKESYVGFMPVGVYRYSGQLGISEVLTGIRGMSNEQATNFVADSSNLAQVSAKDGFITYSGNGVTPTIAKDSLRNDVIKQLGRAGINTAKLDISVEPKPEAKDMYVVTISRRES